MMLKSTVHSPLPLKLRKTYARNSPKQYRPYPIPLTKLSQIIGWIVYHKSHSWFSSLCPHDAPLALKKPITNSPTMAGLLVFSSHQTRNKFKTVIIFINDHHPKKIRMEFLSRFRPIKRKGGKKNKTEERGFCFPSELQQQSFREFFLSLTTDLGNPTSQIDIIASREAGSSCF